MLSLVFSPTPLQTTSELVLYDIAIDAQAEVAIGIAMRPAVDGIAHVPPSRSWRHERLDYWLGRSLDRWVGTAAGLASSHEIFDRVVERCVCDLGLLRSRLRGRHYFAAGVPWFGTLFGRDAAVTGLQTLAFSHRIAGQTAEVLADYQADQFDRYRDAEPGKILHELRRGALARANEIPQSPAYYGSVDATLLFLMLVSSYVDWSGDLALAERLRPNVDRALGWIDEHADHDGDGYVDYVGRYGHGLINQGWKDSGNAIVHGDGSLPEPPIAMVEAQGYVYRAWIDTARLLRRMGDDRAAGRLEERAAELALRFDRDFWSDELGCYLLARARGGQPVTSVASNAGHVLFTGIATPARASAVAARLLQEDMFSGWGIRTLSSRHPAYNPIGYHLGSVWPHDNAIIVEGLRRYRLDGPALQVFSALADAAFGLPQFRLPELFCGYARVADENRPVPYPVACSPQAWAAGSIPHAVAVLFGLRPDAPARRLRIERPVLPQWLDRLELRGTCVGASVVDLVAERRADGTVDVQARAKGDAIEIEVVTAAKSLVTGDSR
jgi:glycogen debranching enzyme